MKENIELNARIVKNWRTGRYKTFSSLSRVMHIKHPKIVERAVKRYLEQAEHQQEVMARALKIAEENQNANDSLHRD